MNFCKQILGNSLSLPAYVREGPGHHFCLGSAFREAKSKKFCGGESKGGRGIFTP
jgi:hypothetical protein